MEKEKNLKKVYLICNAHLDPIWQWEWEEGASATLSTFQSAVNLLDDFDYTFCHNEVTLYKYTEAYAPALFKRIQELVKEGKWHIMGGWYLQPDCVMPEGEGFIRQIREGKLYFEEKFGVSPTTAINFDPFGHSRGLVQIIKKCGQDSYMFMRPYGPEFNWVQLQLPAECFLWEGYDGSRIKAQRTSAYNSPLGGAVGKIQKDIDGQQALEKGLSLWGVGNHGGGPSRQDLTELQAFIESSEIEIVHSTPEEYFAAMEPSAVFDGSLFSCMPGCYTSMIGMKQKYRKLETELYFTEKICSVAALKGTIEYPEKALKSVTEDMLNVQFHDVLPGTVVKSGEENGLAYINHGLRELNQCRADAFFGLCKGQSVAKEGTFPILVFNPKPYAGKQIVACEMSMADQDWSLITDEKRMEIYDENGNRVPCQTVKEESTLNLDWRKKVVFEAELNPLSITRFTAIPKVYPKNKYSVCEDIVFDNGKKQVVISAKTGLIESYKIDGVEYASGKLFEPYLYDDNADPWGMSEDQLAIGVGENPSAFKLMETPDGVFKNMKSLQVIEDGEIYLGAEAFFSHGHSQLRIGYKIYKNDMSVEIEVDLFPGEADKAVKLHVPTSIKGKYIGEQVFGKERLYEDGRECIAHNFVAVEGGGKYLQICTPSTYASSYKDGEVRLTLHRGVGYCVHPIADRPLFRENLYVKRIDQKECNYAFRLDVAEEKELQKKAMEFTEKPYALNIFPTVDEKADNGFTVSSSNPEIQLVTAKKSRETAGYVLRLFNNTAAENSTVVSLGGAKMEILFGRYEVKTLVYNGGKLTESKEMII